MNAELLAGTSGIVLSLAFSYIPKFKDWFYGLDGNYKRLAMLVVLMATAGGIYGLSCTGRFDIAVACDLDGALGLVELFVLASIANQTAYQLTPSKN